MKWKQVRRWIAAWLLRDDAFIICDAITLRGTFMVCGEDGSYPNGSQYQRLKETGRTLRFQVGYVLSHPTMRDGYVALALVPVGAAMAVGR